MHIKDQQFDQDEVNRYKIILMVEGGNVESFTSTKVG